MPNGMWRSCGLGLLLIFSGCAPLSPGSESGQLHFETVATATAQPELLEEEIPLPTATHSAPSADQPLVDHAIADLAERLGIAPDRINVLQVSEVVWPNAGLGCPMPEMRYKQVPVDGILIQLSVDGAIYNYHGGGGRKPFLCTAKGGALPGELPVLPPGSEDI